MRSIACHDPGQVGRRRVTPFLRVSFWAATLFAFTMAVVPRPLRLPGDPSDKILHTLAFLTLTALAAAAYPRTSLLRIGVLLSAFGMLIELVQLIPALNRDGDPIDWIADTLAIGFVAAGIWALRRGPRGTAPD